MGRKVLIVDDAAFMRGICADVLTQYGYEVVGYAEDGQQAAERYNSLRPDTVLMDIVMPVCDGITALREIMGIDKNARVVMLSAKSTARNVAESLVLGAREFVVKPFQVEYLMVALGEVSQDNQPPIAPAVAAQMLAFADIYADEPLSQAIVSKLFQIARGGKTAEEVEALLVSALRPRPTQSDIDQTIAPAAPTPHGMEEWDESRDIHETPAVPGADMPPLELPSIEVPSIKRALPETAHDETIALLRQIIHGQEETHKLLVEIVSAIYAVSGLIGG